MAKSKTPLKYKLLISMLSLIISFLLLEGGMRIVGHYLLSNRIQNQMYKDNINWLTSNDAPEKPPKAQRNVLCVGDSFTYGGSVKPHQTYPALLQDRLAKAYPAQNLAVLNRGICESNTRQLRLNILKWLKEYNPEIVIVLVGAANRFNPWGYDSYKDKDAFSFIKDGFHSLRIVKMFRIMAINIKGQNPARFSKFRNRLGPGGFNIRIQNKFADFVEQHEKTNKDLLLDNPVSIMWQYYLHGNISKALQTGREYLKEHKNQKENILCSMVYFLAKAGEMERAESLLEKTVKQFPDSEFVFGCQVEFYDQSKSYYFHFKKFDKMFDALFHSVLLQPDNNDPYNELVEFYKLQSQFDSTMVYKKLVLLMEENPFLGNYRLFLFHLNFFLYKREYEAKIKKWMLDDINEVVRLCAKNNVKVLLQTYPMEYTTANSVLKEISKKHNLPLIDNTPVFFKLEPKSRYLLDDDHCTMEGHGIMVENIIPVLTSELGIADSPLFE